MHAELLSARWPGVTLKLVIDGTMHVLRWRRGIFRDTVWFDDKIVGAADGVLSRETVFGLVFPGETDDGRRTLLTIDARRAHDWSWRMWTSIDSAPSVAGVRLETDDEVLLATGSFARANDRGDRRWDERLDRLLGRIDAVREKLRTRYGKF